MSFFTKSTGETVEATDSYEVSGIHKTIPEGTELECTIASAYWSPEDSFNAKHIKIALEVTQRGEYQGNTVADKIKIFDPSPATADKALVKLATYDKFAGGMLEKADSQGKQIEDNDALIERSLVGTELIATFATFELPLRDGETEARTINWVRGIKQKQKKAAPVKAAAKPAPAVEPDYDDDIPF